MDGAKSPDFSTLSEFWRKHGFPSVHADAAVALREIAKNVDACRCRRMQRFEDILQGFQLLKYRFKDSARREGARGGWRMIAILEPRTQTLYPIMIYPKKRWETPVEEQLERCVANLVTALQQPELPET